MAELTLDDLKRLHDANYEHNQVTRQKAADDRVFARVSQWDDGLLQDSQLYYRGEFNIIRKATRQITSDLRANPVQVDFAPLDDSREDGAEILDGLYLTDDRRNSTLESYANASDEAVDCGVGGWELITEYETNAIGDRNQVIRRKPIYEANNNSFPDSNAKALDKSDAMNWSILEPYTEDGYKQLYEELTGTPRGDIEWGKGRSVLPASFAFPEQSYVFPWVSAENRLFYVVRFYYKELIDDVAITFVDPFGSQVVFRQSDMKKMLEEIDLSVEDALIEQGYAIAEEKKIKRYKVTRYIASGEDILDVAEIPGPNIPVVHCYGERAFVEGEEIWEGVVRLAKDPQRLRNFMLSYLADIVSRSPRKKPILTPEQVAGFEFMYEENGADNNYPYYLMQAKSADGEQLPQQPIGYMEGSDLPNGMSELVGETREAVADVANPGLPNEFADPDLSGYAIEQLQARFDQQSMVYQENMKFAKRWDAVIYAGMAAVVYDAPRRVTLTGADGERRQVNIMDTVTNPQTGELETVNDITNIEFDVFAEIGPSYTSKKERTEEKLSELALQFKDVDPKMSMALNYKRLAMFDGVDMENLRNYSKKQLLIMGIDEPETEEDVLYLQQQAQQQQEPSAEMLLAQGELLDGQAAMIRAQTDQQNAATNRFKAQVDAYRAETDRIDVQAGAQEKGANINLKDAQTVKTQAETVKTLTEPFRARLRPKTAA